MRALWGHCGPGLLTEGGISGLQDSPCGQGGGEGHRGPQGVRYKEVYGCEKRGKESFSYMSGCFNMNVLGHGIGRSG